LRGLSKTLSLAACAALFALAGCAGAPPSPQAPAAAEAERPAVPLLRLPPASLGRTLSLQQQITVRYPSPQGEQTRDILALLEADAGHTRLAAVAGGQVLARLDWDGSDLQVTRAPWAPAELVPERILSDLQLSLWPVAAIRAALPPGWHIEAMPGMRQLLAGDELVAEIRYPDAATTEFEQRRDGYRLTIRTLQGEGTRP